MIQAPKAPSARKNMTGFVKNNVAVTDFWKTSFEKLVDLKSHINRNYSNNESDKKMNLSKTKVLQNASCILMPVMPFSAGGGFGCEALMM